MDAVADLLDIDIDAQPRTVLYWYNENAAGPEGENSDICLYCASCGGCYMGSTIFSTSKNVLHELVHAVVVPAWGRSDSLFEEGIAGGLDRRLEGVVDVETIFSVLGNESPTEMAGTGLHSDGHFSRWLVDRFGPEKFSELFEQLTNSDSKDAVFSAVESIYGVSFDDLETEYFATAPTVYPIPGFCDGLLHVPWTTDRWELSVGAQCDAPHVYGPRDDGSLFIVATIDIPPEYVGVSLASWIPSDATASVWPCLDEPLYDVEPQVVGSNLISNNGPTSFRIAGRHRIELEVPGDVDEVYLRLCPDNGKFPGSYPTDPSVDPQNCVGD